MAIADIKADQEPSIEEILESIRQIISEDGKPAEKQANPGKPLDLAPSQAAAPPASSLAMSTTPTRARP